VPLGVNDPPAYPDEENPPAGDTDIGAFTVRVTLRVVLPLPFVVLVKMTLSVWLPAARLFAPELNETVTVALPPAASVPPVDERLIHDCFLLAVHFTDALPGFCSV
jgi:hypothetical protein